MKRFLLSLLLMSGFSLTAAQADSLTVMSYNIRYDNPDDRPSWPQRREAMLEQIRFHAPDIMGLQEALMPMVDYLAAGVEDDYAHYGLGRDDGKSEGETTTVFYNLHRFTLVMAETKWCSDTPNVPSKSLDADLPRTFTRLVLEEKVSGRRLDVRNVHMDHIGEESRRACARQIDDLPAYPEARIIVMGDFNADTASVPYATLTHGTLGLKDSRFSTTRRLGPSGTFNGFDITRSGDPIDHILVDKAFTVRRFGVLTEHINGLPISDHYPLLTELD